MKNQLISKIRCNNPNKKSSASRNYNYLLYIATRAGTDLSPIDGAPALGHGLFGNIDVTDAHAVARQLYNLTKSGHNIYNGIISLTEEDAISLGYTHKGPWVHYLNSVMPSVAREFGIPINNLKWTASVHMEAKHPHCHYMLWSDPKKIRSPFIHPSVENRIREYLSGEISREERMEQAVDRTAERDAIIAFGKERMGIISEEINALVSHPFLPHKMSTEQVSALSRQILQVLPKLPTQGRLNYKFMPDELKTELNQITESLLKHKDIEKQVLQYYQLTEDLSKSYSASQTHRIVNSDIARQDLYTRIGNIVLKNCKAILKNNDVPDLDRDLEPPADPTDPVSSDPVFSDPSFPDDHTADSVFDLDLQEVPDTEAKYALFWSEEYKHGLALLYTQKNIAEAEKVFLQEAAKNNALAYEQLGKLHHKNLLESSDPNKAFYYYQQALHGFQQLYKKTEKKADYLSYKIGNFYEQGLGAPVDIEKASNYYMAASNNKYAMFRLANIILHEKSEKLTPEKFNTALELMKRSADQGFSYAAYTYAKLAETHNAESPEEYNKYYEIALKNFESAQDKNGQLIYRIGTMYYKGTGTAPNPERAYQYFLEAATHKNANAYYALAKTYADPQSQYYSPQAAEKYFLLALESGKNYACTPLARLYLSATDLFNPEKALYYLKKGTETSDHNAAYLYAQTAEKYNLASPADLIKYYQMALDGYEKADSKSNTVLYRLWTMYSKGLGTNCDLDKALFYLKACADSGNPQAAYQYATTIDQLNLSEDICQKYYKIAFDAYQNRENKDGNILYRLGTMYFKGQGVEKNDSLAFQFFLSAAETQNPNAYYALAKTYADTDSPYFSASLAEKYFLLALESGKNYACTSLAKLYLDSDKNVYDPQKAIKILKIGMRNNDINSYAMLGSLYLWGTTGIENNYHKGIELLNYAIENGSDFAKNTVKMYNDMIQNKVQSCCYTIFCDTFSNLSLYNRQRSFQLKLKHQSKSKEQTQAEIQHSKI